MSQPQPPRAFPSPVDPAQAYLGHPAVQYARLAVVACRLCGSVPAVDVTFRGHQGLVLIMRFLSVPGPFCRDCGLATFRRMTSRTLGQGWYGYASLLITPVTVLINLVRRRRVASLAAPRANPYAPSRTPTDPGPRLLERPLTWAGLGVPVALSVLLVLVLGRR